MMYKNFEIDCSTYDFITVFFCGDDYYFSSIEDAKAFIDSIE